MILLAFLIPTPTLIEQVQNLSSSGAGSTPAGATTDETSTNDQPSSGAQSTTPMTSAGAISSFVAAAAVLSILG
jgi:hypothetical protein